MQAELVEPKPNYKVISDQEECDFLASLKKPPFYLPTPPFYLPTKQGGVGK